MTAACVRGDQSAPARKLAVGLTGISKRYPGVQANRDIELVVQAGSIHGLLGENGAGKSTLMNILFGLVRPDAGKIEVFGRNISLNSPADAIAAGIGMVQQHFSLIPVFTVTENLILGHEPTRRAQRLDLDKANREIRELSDRYGFRIDPTRRVSDMAVGARQRVEILKALYHGAEILILDEPTAALAPHETVELFDVLRELRARGRTVIFISHKLREIIELCDRVTVLRDGAVVGNQEMAPEERSSDEARRALEGDLAHMMVGRELPAPPSSAGVAGAPLLHIQGLGDGDKLGPLDLEVKAGEILGVAGVEGNGQTELVELLLGLRPAVTGRIVLDATDITQLTVRNRLRSGIAHIAEDRHLAAVSLKMSIAENAALGFHDRRLLSPGPHWLSFRRMLEFAASLVRRFRIHAVSPRLPVASLSGGNQQKLVVGRELARDPRLMIAAQPTRGLDVGAAAFVHQQLAALRERGRAVLLISLDLTEVMALSDRIVVLSGGRIVGAAKPGDVDAKTLGTWMTGGVRPASPPAEDSRATT